jgi:hypothetical protein
MNTGRPLAPQWGGTMICHAWLAWHHRRRDATVAGKVILVPHEGTGSAAARCNEPLASWIRWRVRLWWSIRADRLTGLNCAGLVVDVIPV